VAQQLPNLEVDPADNLFRANQGRAGHVHLEAQKKTGQYSDAVRHHQAPEFRPLLGSLKFRSDMDVQNRPWVQRAASFMERNHGGWGNCEDASCACFGHAEVRICEGELVLVGVLVMEGGELVMWREH
jgi:hypothetical protein